MSKVMSQEELNLHVSEAASAISDLMCSLATSENEKHKKRSMLIGYWLKKYATIIKKEPSFLPKSLPKYKRGQIVQIDFGFRPGKELGGRHYAVVLDTKNDLTSPILTVIPLLSFKPDKFKKNRFTALLPDGVFMAIYSKVNGLVAQAKELVSSAEQLADNPELAKAKKEAAKPIITMASAALDELDHLRSGTVSNTCQIMTVSKLRIERPLNTNDIIYGVRISDRDMDVMYSQLKDLYLV